MDQNSHKQPSSYSLTNVRLETGFEYDGNDVVATKTELFSIEVNEGIITAVSQSDHADSAAIDMNGKLMLPAFKDMHTHLDKTLYGLPWKAISGKERSVKDMIALEQKIIPELLQTSVERTCTLIELLQSYGIHHARSHFNIDPTSGLRSLEHLEQALLQKKDSFSAELVAFPQHGIFYTDTAPLMKEVAQMDGVAYIGGLDPTTIDGSVEKQLDFVVQLALEHHKGVDIHLHEIGNTGIKTIEYLINKVAENPELKNKTYISHAFALAYMSDIEVETLAAKLAASGIGIATALPYGKMQMPLPALWKHGVKVLVGNDNIQDHWGTLGSGSLLQKANLAAGLYGWETEWQLSRLLKMATNGLLPLDDSGNMVWPKVGDQANFVLVHASCSAEAVSRVSKVEHLVHAGSFVF